MLIGIEENQEIDVQSNRISIPPKQLKAHLGTKQLSAHSCSIKLQEIQNVRPKSSVVNVILLLIAKNN